MAVGDPEFIGTARI